MPIYLQESQVTFSGYLQRQRHVTPARDGRWNLVESGLMTEGEFGGWTARAHADLNPTQPRMGLGDVVAAEAPRRASMSS